MIITTPGVYSITEAEYHADPCEPFSLSRGITHLIVYHDSDLTHETAIQIDGDTTHLHFIFDDVEADMPDAVSAYLPTALAVQMARAILRMAGEVV